MREAEEKGFFVLVVESNPEALLLVQRSLEEVTPFPSTLDRAANIEEALSKMKSYPYHLLLMETQPDNQNWRELLAQMRHAHLDLPFVLMTPTRDDRFAQQALQEGIANLLVENENQFRDLAERLVETYRSFYQKAPHPDRLNKDPFQARKGDAVEGQTIPRQRVYRLPMQDELTGLYNHTYANEWVIREFSRAARYGYSVACLLIDIDHFKTVNEERGFRIGDTLLQECADLLFENCRLSDLIARYGGEQFVILLPHENYEGALELANRLRLVFAEHLFSEDVEKVNITVSIGISAYPEDSMERRCELLAYANQALFRSKAAGRNRVTLYKEMMSVIGERLPELKVSEDKIIQFQRLLSEISYVARRSYIEASKALITVLESKDRFTAGHAANCAKYSMQIAEAMGMTVDEAEIVEHAALLHDIGKICIPDNVLLKTSKLTFIEFEAMKQHPYLGYKILKPIKFLQEEAVLVLHHHEWFNGEGYPCRLAGNEIPLGARILCVIDAYDTIRIAGGRYKKTGTVEEAVNELVSCAGTQFDPEVVRVFIEVLKMRKELTNDSYSKEQLEEALRKSRTSSLRANSA